MLLLEYYGRCSYLCCGATAALGVEMRGATVELYALQGAAGSKQEKTCLARLPWGLPVLFRQVAV